MRHYAAIHTLHWECSRVIKMIKKFVFLSKPLIQPVHQHAVTARNHNGRIFAIMNDCLTSHIVASDHVLEQIKRTTIRVSNCHVNYIFQALLLCVQSCQQKSPHNHNYHHNPSNTSAYYIQLLSHLMLQLELQCTEYPADATALQSTYKTK